MSAVYNDWFFGTCMPALEKFGSEVGANEDVLLNDYNETFECFGDPDKALAHVIEFHTECLSVIEAVGKITGYAKDYLHEVYWESIEDGRTPIEAVESITAISLEHDW